MEALGDVADTFCAEADDGVCDIGDFVIGSEEGGIGDAEDACVKGRVGADESGKSVHGGSGVADGRAKFFCHVGKDGEVFQGGDGGADFCRGVAGEVFGVLVSVVIGRGQAGLG